MAVIITCFYYFRSKFSKQFHALNGWLCTLYTIIIFYAVSSISPTIRLSFLLIICFSYLINLISFIIRDYFDLRDRINAGKVEIKRGISKELLQNMCEFAKVNQLQTDILIEFYCDRKSLLQLSRKYCYSPDNISVIKSKAILKIKEAYNK